MSSTANQQRARKSCEWLESPNLILSTASLLLIFLLWPPVARAQLLSPSPHSSPNHFRHRAPCGRKSSGRRVARASEVIRCFT